MRANVCVFWLVLCVSVVGCAKTATITTNHGEYEAEILRSDHQAIYVMENDATEERMIMREDIRDIDHPGNVGLIVFGVHSVASASLAVALIGAGVSSGCNDSDQRSGVIVSGLCGISTMMGSMAAIAALGSAVGALVSYLTWSESVDNAEAPEDAELSIVPIVAPHEDGIWGGVSVQLRF